MFHAILRTTLLLPALFITALAAPLHSTRDQKWIDIKMISSVSPPLLHDHKGLHSPGPSTFLKRDVLANDHDVRRMQRPAQLVRQFLNFPM
jgi:hypothetical protein